MRLVELNPRWTSSGGEGIFNRDESGELIPAPVNEHAALDLDCPCGCKVRRTIPCEKGHGNQWQIHGDFDFETLTLTPSIQVTTGCRTHFCVSAGNITP